MKTCSGESCAGRLARLDTRTGDTLTLAHTAWWVRAAPNAVAWQNEKGTWLLPDGGVGAPVRIAGPDGDPARLGDGPTVLLSPDGTRALLGWQEESDAQYELVEADGSRRRIATKLCGYFGNSAVLWLDSSRVLFQIVANAPRRGEPSYRESGWHGALALLDLRTNTYARVVNVPDGIYLHVAGRYLDDVLATEWDTTGARAHWLYDTRTWRRRATPLPKGRAFASAAGAVVILLDVRADNTDGVLVAGGETKVIGRVARDAEPVFSPNGGRGALGTAKGLMIIER